MTTRSVFFAKFLSLKVLFQDIFLYAHTEKYIQWNNFNHFLTRIIPAACDFFIHANTSKIEIEKKLLIY